ncbi:alpha-L-iduronidase [Thrips palmi]|uniref:Alpha-L-iduronidase n=1 Tax=Thrips palmi TaxID=161013 RepID=A0A6P8Y3J1_THRPL|nr:alpha-L-iduronidase [Thrips palmi]
MGCVTAVEAVGEAVEGALGRSVDPRRRPPQPRPLITNITAQADLWRCLVGSTVAHLGDRYGSDVIKTWRFETWNEPDLRQYDTFNWTVDGYMAYFNATVQGLRDAEKRLNVSLRLGGPAGTFKSPRKHPICWHVLDHCDRLTARNQSCGLDFISFHRKGNGSSEGVANGTMTLLGQILRRFPHLQRLPFANDEADPLTGWWRLRGWRGDLRYANMIIHAVVDLQNQWRRHQGCGAHGCHPRCPGPGPRSRDGVLHVDVVAHHADCLPRLPPLELLSNDNGFLETTASHFTQRTLLASFHLPASESRGSRGAPPAFHMFRKPAMTAMALLAFMEGSQLPVRTDIQPPVEAGLRLSVLAALSASSADVEGEGAVASLLVAFSNETQRADGQAPAAAFTVHVADLPLGPGTGDVVLARVWALRTSPADLWLAAGAPQRPPASLRRDIFLPTYRGKALPFAYLSGGSLVSQVPRLEQAREFRVGNGSADVTLEFTVPLATNSMVQIFTPPAKPPRKVSGLRARNVTYNEVLLVWSDVGAGGAGGADGAQSRHVTAYEVGFRPSPAAPFRVISPASAAVGQPWMLFPAFHYAPEPGAVPPGSAPGLELTRGEYRVAAVNVWGQSGPPSFLAYPSAAASPASA